jgi:glycosyltransferase involved in cell wall biosynthesis
MVFFDQHKPLMYKWEYYIILSWLKDIFYQNFSNYFDKYKYLYLLEKNLKNSKKILCLDENTKDELIERFNTTEEKITLLDGFFIKNDFISDDKDISLDIRSKFQIWEKYLVYSGWDGIEKNLDRLIHVFHRLHKEGSSLDLVFLGWKIWKNIDLRHAVIENDLQKNIHFIDSVKPWEEKLIYQQSIGVIFPSLYESFPFRLSNPLLLSTPILSSKLVNIEHVFWSSITYFSPISTTSILEAVKLFMQNSTKANYTKILKKNNIENTSKQLIDIIR